MCKVALVGNPNCGKSTLFNRLTNSHEKVGNRAGVTVDVAIAKIANTSVTLCDLAGCYSLEAFTKEEQLSIEYLFANVKKVINVVDCTRLERGLKLTNQLLDNHFDVMVALTMCDEATRLGLSISEKRLEQQFNIPFVKVQAKTGQGLEKIIEFSRAPYKKPPKPQPDVKEALEKAKVTQPTIKKERADNLLLGKFSFLFLILILFATFFVAVGGLAQSLTNLVFALGDFVKVRFENWLEPHLSYWALSLFSSVLDSIFLVASFTPQITLLFGVLTLLEDTGYMARISFLCDKPLTTLGLSGQSAISLLLACGCAVPSVMSTRTIKNPFEKHSLCTLAPLMPCSAKTLLVGLFASQFKLGWVWVAFYLTSIVAVTLGGKILKGFSPKDNSLFVFEMPPYRTPDFLTVAKLMWQRAFQFVVKAFQIILPAGIVAWTLSSFDLHFRFTDQIDQSILANVGKILEWLFYPLGFGKWQFVASTICGLTAKEAVLSTMQVLGANLGDLTFGGAFSFVCFNLTTIPCLATVATIFKELGFSKALVTILFQFAFSWAFCCLLHLLFQAGAWSLIFIVPLVAWLFWGNIKGNRSCDCLNCNNCKKSSPNV